MGGVGWVVVVCVCMRRGGRGESRGPRVDPRWWLPRQGTRVVLAGPAPACIAPQELAWQTPDLCWLGRSHISVVLLNGLAMGSCTQGRHCGPTLASSPRSPSVSGAVLEPSLAGLRQGWRAWREISMVRGAGAAVAPVKQWSPNVRGSVHPAGCGCWRQSLPCTLNVVAPVISIWADQTQRAPQPTRKRTRAQVSVPRRHRAACSGAPHTGHGVRVWCEFPTF